MSLPEAVAAPEIHAHVKITRTDGTVEEFDVDDVALIDFEES